MDYDELRARAAAAGPYVRDPDNHSMEEATRIVTEECQLSVTHAAQVFAAARQGPAGLDSLMAAVRSELVHELYHGMGHPSDLMFSTMDWEGHLNILIYPSDGKMIVDLAGEPVLLRPESGPVAGMKVSVPQPFTDADPPAAPSPEEETQ